MRTEKMITRTEKMINFLKRIDSTIFDTKIKQLEKDLSLLYIKLFEERLG